MKKLYPGSWHPGSWSQQAREMGSRIYNIVVCAFEDGYSTDEFAEYIGKGDFIKRTPEEWATHFWTISCRPPIIVYRAAKRYGRKLRQYKARHKTN